MMFLPALLLPNLLGFALVSLLLLLGVDRGLARGKGFLISVATLPAMFLSYFMDYVTTSNPPGQGPAPERKEYETGKG